MIVIRSLNNNMILALDDNGTECICQGKGIGFGKRKNDIVNDLLIERRFVPESKAQSSNFQELFKSIPDTFWEISESVIEYAKEYYAIKAPSSLILSLSDHMSGAVERYREGVTLTNPMLIDIKRLYPKEFKVGKFAIKRLEEEFGFEMEEDEAAFLAYHFITADLKRQSQNVPVEAVTKISTTVLSIVEQAFQVTLDEEDWNYQRFLTHLKFFVRRVTSGELYQDTPDDELYEELKKKYPHVHKCVEKVCDYILIECHYEVTNEERLYLLVHIERVTRSQRFKH